MHILHIEPDTVLAKAYGAAYKDAGVDVKMVSSGQRAIDAADKQLPDCVVLEVQLAGQSGIDFLHELRSYEDWVAIPVVVYSQVPQHAFGVGQGVWEKLGVKRYLYKNEVPMQHMVAIVMAMAEK